MSIENERAWPVVANPDNCCGNCLFTRHSALRPDSYDVTPELDFFFRPRAGPAAKAKQFQGLIKVVINVLPVRFC